MCGGGQGIRQGRAGRGSHVGWEGRLGPMWAGLGGFVLLGVLHYLLIDGSTIFLLLPYSNIISGGSGGGGGGGGDCIITFISALVVVVSLVILVVLVRTWMCCLWGVMCTCVA